MMNTISLRDAIATHGSDIIDAVRGHKRHRTDDQGGIYWIEDELAELVELVAIQRAREDADLQQRLAEHEAEQ